MKLLAKIILIAFVAILASCSSGLYNVDKSYIKGITNIKEFDISDFEIYVFNVCEKFDRRIDFTDRFCDCPEDFYKLKREDSIKKIEEVYFLINKRSDLALYFTTYSQKYISNKQQGFLNDPKLYKDQINLNKIEYVYVGSINRLNKFIHFRHSGIDEDIFLHYRNNPVQDALLIERANVATAENNYDITEEIALDNVFSTKLNYKRRNYRIVYHKRDTARTVEKLIFTTKKGKLNILFKFKDYKKKLYKIGSQRLRYQLNYYQIDTITASIRKKY